MSKKGSLDLQEGFVCPKCLGKGLNPYNSNKKCGYCKGTGIKTK